MMAGWDVFVNGKKWKVPNRGVSASGETTTSVLQRCFSIGEMNSAAQWCFSIMKNH
jgi:hypothetical protein